MEESPRKRRKLHAGTVSGTSVVIAGERNTTPTSTPGSTSLSRPISPPPSRRARSKTSGTLTPQKRKHEAVAVTSQQPPAYSQSPQLLPSPIRLTKIRDLSPEENADAIGLRDILGDPLIKECWNFNYLFNVDWVMQHFDPDVRSLVKLKIVHGFWRKEDANRHRLMEAAERYPNVGLISAYMPDPFGTHHSKMLILIRHDDQAQVVIHTANMISRDWANMTQAVWLSPLLPLGTSTSSASSSLDKSETASHPIGSGERFKTDLLRYLSAYGKRLTDLTAQLRQYDFSSIRAAFVGSTPSRQKPELAKPATQSSWGWLGLREILSTIPVRSDPLEEKSSEAGKQTATPNIVVQISSIATLGANPTWLTNFQSVLSTHKTSEPDPKRSSFFTPKHRSSAPSPKPIPNPTLSIIFPTAQEIRLSLDGYASGDSIHMKLQSAAQQAQLQYLRPLMCHWNPGACGIGTAENGKGKQEETHIKSPEEKDSEKKWTAHRNNAAPHIKTYIRFQDSVTRALPSLSPCPSSPSSTTITPWGRGSPPKIDWALVTSANLSKQAWGDVVSASKGEIWIQSWECGVVVWPGLFGGGVEMCPVFGRDCPAGDLDLDVDREGGEDQAGGREGHGGEDEEETEDDEETEDEGTEQPKGKIKENQKATITQIPENTKPHTLVGLRMPYDLPLERYRADEAPWCATMAYAEPDWMGRVWKAYRA